MVDRVGLLGMIGLCVVGCADPCFDDGLGQGGCPEQATDTDTDGDPSAASQTASMSDSAGSMSMTGATMTATETETEGTATESATQTPSDTDVVSESDSAGECPELQELLVPETPTFQIVVDQSGSMDADFGGVSRWEAMEATLIDPDDGIVTNQQSSVRFGLSLYQNTGGACPGITEIAPQLDARDEIETLLGPEQPGGDTPTGESLQLVVASLMDDEWEGPKYLLLATDGEPDTCAVPDPQSMMEINMVRNVAIDAVSAAFDAGVQTFVISVGDEVAEGHLQDLADAGRGEADAEFYVALDQDTLNQAFNDIINSLRECELELPSELEEQYAPSCEVTVNDEAFPFDDPDGWRLNDPTHIELQGAACSAIQEGLVAIQMNCTCVAE